MRGRLDRKTIKNTGYLLNAYMTLEACFIVPIAVILTAFLLILTFYLYTVCFLNQGMSERKRRERSWKSCFRKR